MHKLPEVLLPLACLPDVEYFVWLSNTSQARLEIHETYPKQTCRTRYRIASAEGTLQLSVPVIRQDGNHTPTNRVLLAGTDWNRIHWRAIESAYNKSPFFLYYKDDFEAIFAAPPSMLMEFNLKLLKLCCSLSGIKTSLNLTLNYEKQPANCPDLRQKFMPKHPVNQKEYIKHFKPYIQVFSDRNPFIPNLSILDVLFNLGPGTADYLRQHELTESS